MVLVECGTLHIPLGYHLGAGSDKTKADEAIAGLRIGIIPSARAGKPVLTSPTSATEHTVLAADGLLGSERVCLLDIRICAPPVEHPLFNIAMHIIKTPGIGFL